MRLLVALISYHRPGHNIVRGELGENCHRHSHILTQETLDSMMMLTCGPTFVSLPAAAVITKSVTPMSAFDVKVSLCLTISLV